MKRLISVFKYIITTILILLLFTEANAQIVKYLDVDATGSGDGNSWTNAYTTIYDAVAEINALSHQNIELRIAEGTYKVSATSVRTNWLTVSAKTRVAIFGGYTANTSDPEERNITANETIISGDIGIELNNGDNTYHVIKYDGGTGSIKALELNGVIIEGGNANKNDGSDEDYGGGVCVIGNASLFVKDCIFRLNSGKSFAAIYYNQNDTYASRTTDCSIYDSEFSNNMSTSEGGAAGIFSKTSILNGVTFNSNQSSTSAGALKISVHSMSIMNTVFKDNIGTSLAGAIKIVAGTVDIKNTLFNNNSSSLGSAIEIIDKDAPANVEIINSVFTKHDITNGLIHISNNGDISGTPTCNIGNSIVWGNIGTVNIKSTSGLTPTVTYSAVQGGNTSNGNINADPQFTDSDNDNYYPKSTSPVINGGSNALLDGLSIDYNNQPRVTEFVVDMGIYEADGAFPSITTQPANATVTANQTLNLSVVCTGSNLSYQWYKDGNILHGETNSTLSVANANSDHAGAYKVKITSSILDLESDEATVTINLIELTVEAESYTYKYGDEIAPFELKTVDYPVGTSSAMFDTEPSVTCVATKTSVPSTYPVVVDAGTSKYFDVTKIDGATVIDPAPLTITAENKSSEYGEPRAALTVIYSGFKNGQSESSFTVDKKPDIAVTTDGTTAIDNSTDVGVYTDRIVPSNCTFPNYTFTYVKGDYTVTKAVLTATAEDKTKVYGAVNPEFTVAYTGFKNSQDKSVIQTEPTITTLAVDESDVDDYDITLSGGSDENYDFTLVNGELVVEKKELTVTADNKNREYGDINPVLTVSYSGFIGTQTETDLTEEPIAYTAANSASAAGDYNILLSGGNDDNYRFTLITGTLTVDPAQLTITAEDKTSVYGDAVATLTVNYSGFKNGQAESSFTADKKPNISVTSDGTSAIDNSTDVGLYTDRIVPSGCTFPNYTFTYETGDYTVSKAVLTATAEDKTKVYGVANPELTIVYSGFKNSQDKSVLQTEPTIATLAVEGSDVNDYDITLSGGSDENYDFNLVNGNITIEKKELTVTAEDKTRIYGDVNPALTISYTGFIGTQTKAVLVEEPVIHTTANSGSDIGDYDILLSGGNDDNYRYTLVSGTLKVNPALLTITAEDKTSVYGDAVETLTVAYSGFKNGQTETGFADDKKPEIKATTNGTTVIDNATDASVYTDAIEANNCTFPNYTFTYVKGKYTISKAPLEVKIKDLEKVYGDANPTLEFIYSGFKLSDDETNIDTRPVAETTADISSAVGTYPITFMTNGTDANYDLVESGDGVLTVKKAVLTATPDNKSRKYGEGDPEFTIAYTGFITGEDKSVIETEPLAYTVAELDSDVGIYDILLIGGSDENYTFDFGDGDLTIEKAPLEVKADDKIREYGEDNPTFTITYTGFKNGETIDDFLVTDHPVLTPSLPNTTDAGDHDMMPSGGNFVNYEPDYKKGVLTITKAPLTAKAQDISREYGEANPTTFEIEYSGFKLTDGKPDIETPPVGSVTADINSGVGEYNITLTSVTDNNYIIDIQNTGILEITKAALTVTPVNATREYGDGNPEFEYNIVGFKNSEDKSVLTKEPFIYSEATAAADIGTPEILAVGGVADNYTFSYNVGILTITKAELTIKANSITREYGDPNPDFTFTYSGFKNGQTISDFPPEQYPTASVNADENSGVNAYPIIPENATFANYEERYENGTLNVTKAQLIATVKNVSRIYGEMNPDFEVIYTGFKNDDTIDDLDSKPIPQTNANSGTNVGEYAIELLSGLDDNYEITEQDGKLLISRAQLTLTAGDKSMNYGEELPLLSYTVSGFVNGDNSSVFIAQPTITTNATSRSKVGEYEILVGNASAENYNIITVNGTLTIYKSPQTITFNSFEQAQLSDGYVSIDAKSSSGLPLTFTSSNQSVARIQNHAVALYNVGVTTITAIQNGNDNYEKAISVSQQLVIVESATDVDNKKLITIVFWPNPVNNTINIRFPENSERYIIYDANGRPLIDEYVSSDEVSQDMSSYGNGIYFIKILVNGEWVSAKFIISR
jgi:hypothetical protein